MFFVYVVPALTSWYQIWPADQTKGVPAGCCLISWTKIIYNTSPTTWKSVQVQQQVVSVRFQHILRFVLLGTDTFFQVEHFMHFSQLFCWSNLKWHCPLFGSPKHPKINGNHRKFAKNIVKILTAHRIIKIIVTTHSRDTVTTAILHVNALHCQTCIKIWSTNVDQHTKGFLNKLLSAILVCQTKNWIITLLMITVYIYLIIWIDPLALVHLFSPPIPLRGIGLIPNNLATLGCYHSYFNIFHSDYN